MPNFSPLGWIRKELKCFEDDSSNTKSTLQEATKFISSIKCKFIHDWQLSDIQISGHLHPAIGNLEGHAFGGGLLLKKT